MTYINPHYHSLPKELHESYVLVLLNQCHLGIQQVNFKEGERAKTIDF